jgi:hypothetical protein
MIPKKNRNLGIVSEEVPHYKKNFESNFERNVKQQKMSRRKRPPTDRWRLNDEEFNELHKLCSFTVEGCCDSLGLNGHKNLSFYSEQNSFSDHDVSGQLVYCNPPWFLAIECVKHIRACHSKSPLGTRAVIVLLVWPKF